MDFFSKKPKKWKSQILNFFIKAFASPKAGVQYHSETNYVKFTTKWSKTYLALDGEVFTQTSPHGPKKSLNYMRFSIIPHFVKQAKKHKIEKKMFKRAKARKKSKKYKKILKRAEKDEAHPKTRKNKI